MGFIILLYPLFILHGIHYTPQLFYTFISLRLRGSLLELALRSAGILTVRMLMLQPTALPKKMQRGSTAVTDVEE